ncbi:MAG: hypothetical protein COZ37_04985 [bacterium (Candidatus Ratteibacteria) CG_4_10_14_3_um_filter_41_18]|uniref:GAD domain-containing protein n=3 Tax=Candidatus Ratteibacteria TaxID=2979319 RepID=A0A2M7YFI2_9BACT|nr:MAG: hypothetical protein COW28_04575 [bacterium (Candidatus Ratteibacteria) CG15_BIG_FIL_POST_REV_8_21_14_020_41_12]PIX76993.1 MAG: hypothetical protein COZ37_04985 [bacterium (Candidatus Ratteibacteria) CG_4_10_14_3_um_filter_41_18]PJA61733.1 MAG: hypothetical protein CO162_04775 [bacterium (Candidatus Ratteibacteria) CG_4_9_14_3_um_filter_41_21]
MKEITGLFKSTNSKLIKGIVDSGGAVVGTKVENFVGVLLEKELLATDLQKKVEATGAKGFISTDELPKYGISKEDKETIKKEFEAGEKDVVIFVAASQEEATKSVEVIEAELKKKN